MTNTSGIGRRFEYKIRDYLKKDGYFVIRSAKSSFPDLTAIRKGEAIRFIECKKNKYLNEEDRKKIKNFKKKTGMDVDVAYPKKEMEEIRIIIEKVNIK